MNPVKYSLSVKTKRGTKIIPAGKWFVNQNTPVGEPADFYERKPYGGKKLIIADEIKQIES